MPTWETLTHGSFTPEEGPSESSFDVFRSVSYLLLSHVDCKHVPAVSRFGFNSFKCPLFGIYLFVCVVSYFNLFSSNFYELFVFIMVMVENVFRCTLLTSPKFMLS